ncbi:biotin/lipoyl-containing protein, partial [Micrococcus terreus]|uniref:biotin/lipoyl-containing protein n=1 Tax=Micrococcus terreus TaxID=574650 RepID=UPI0030B8DACD
MLKVFNLPDLGEGLTESEILTWKVAEGDQVIVNQVLADVETAKAVVELSSPFEGAIARLHAEPGTVVEVGAPIISFELPGESGGESPPAGEASAQDRPDGGTQALPDGRVPTLVGYGAAADTGKRPARRAKAGGAGTQAPPQPQGTAPS